MSREAWGDDGDAQELPDGWWSECEVEVVQQCIRDLMAEPFYEGGVMANGISTRFLARLTILRGEAGLIPTDGPLYREAEAMFRDDASGVACPHCGKPVEQRVERNPK